MTTADPARFSGQLPRTEPEVAAGIVPNGATVAVSGFGGVGYPKAVPPALRTHESLTVVSAGGVGGEIDEELVDAGVIDRRTHFQTRHPMREAINAGEIAFFDRHVSKLGDEIQFGTGLDLDVAIIEAIAVGEDWLIPSTSIGHTPAMVSAADLLIVEVNQAQPGDLAALHDMYDRNQPPEREPIPLGGPLDRIGEPRIRFHSDTLAAVVESNVADDPYTFREPTSVDRTIGEQLGTLLAEEARHNPLLDERIALQFGVGSMGNALMGALAATTFADRELVYFGEVIQDGLLELLDAGQLIGASATSLALSADCQGQFFDDVAAYTDNIVLRPASLSNNPALIDRFGVIGINSAVEVDCYGNANTTHIGGTQLLNGIGGGLDFSRHSHLSIIALPSTTSDGEISRIVPMTPHVDHTEHDVDVVITEHGVADLRGKSPRERAATIIEIAHPSFRSELRKYIDRAKAAGGHIPHDLSTAFDWHRR